MALTPSLHKEDPYTFHLKHATGGDQGVIRHCLKELDQHLIVVEETRISVAKKRKLSSNAFIYIDRRHNIKVHNSKVLVFLLLNNISFLASYNYHIIA